MNQSISRGKAVVTGATGGIGAAYAKGLAQRGYDLLLVGRTQSALEDLSKQIAADTGKRVDISVCNLAEAAEVDAMVALLAGDSSITLLANLAGVAAFSPFADIATEKIEEIIAVNVSALTRLCHAVVPQFLQRGSGTIVNFASVLAFRPWAEFNVYNASKAYVVTLSQSLQAALQEKGVLVQVVAPPATATGFWQGAGFSYTNLPPQALMQPEDLIAAALVGLDKGEQFVLPSLADSIIWDKFQESRTSLVKGMMSGIVAERYRSPSAV